MEQYFDLVWKNYTALRSQNSDEDVSDQDDGTMFLSTTNRNPIDFFSFSSRFIRE